MTNPVPAVTFEPVKYAACALPRDHSDYADYVIRVVLRPHDQWEVFHAGPQGKGGHGGKYLNADGRWCSPDEHHWWSRDVHLFDDLDTARALAMDAALTITVHGRTAADVIAADKAAVVR
ncbi:hypothetical protein [Streptomyces sp. NPDC013489]|uniref:hypothetical protein n=1 Tax=Streptomyces sp. NPDC013489 TaxID=3155606 RepID=UPI0033F69209